MESLESLNARLDIEIEQEETPLKLAGRRFLSQLDLTLNTGTKGDPADSLKDDQPTN